MNLTPEQKIYLDDQLSSVSRALLDEYFAEGQSLSSKDMYGTSTDQIAALRIRRLAKNLSDARANKFIEVFRKYKAFPDDNEYADFATENRLWIIDKPLQLFDETCSNVFANTAPQGVVNTIRQSLAFDLQMTIYAKGLQPISSFLIEGEAEPKAKGKRNWGTIWTAVGVFVAIGIAILAIVSPEVRQFACDKVGLLCRQTP